MIRNKHDTTYYFHDTGGVWRISRTTEEHQRGGGGAGPQAEDRPSTRPTPQGATKASFRGRMRAARADVVARQQENAPKRAIAMQLRALRDARGMTQADVARAADMTQSAVARMEALTGPVPSVTSIERYVAACKGHMALMISTETIDLRDVALTDTSATDASPPTVAAD